MESTANLRLPYIMPSQAQKHVTHNEALVMLNAIVQLGIRDRDLEEPPGDPQQGDRYIVAAHATGAWAGWDGAIALRMDGGWRRIDPQTGWLAWIEDEETLVLWTGTAWADLGAALADTSNLALLGVGTAANAENPFTAKLNKALWTALYEGEGGDGDLRYTLNKEGPAGVLSLLMQSDWSGRAEIGLIGDDDLAVKVSPDGSSWKEAIRLDRATGAAGFPHTPALNALAGLTGTNGGFVRFTGAGAAVMQAILGPVSQAGGVPTGALIETGSNANGDYARFANGLQIAWRRDTGSIAVNMAYGSLFRSEVQSWTPAAAFVNNPILIGSWMRSDASGWIVPAINSAADHYLVSPVGSGSNTKAVYVMMIGRWF